MDGLHFQIALPRSDGEARDEGTARALGELVDAAAEHWRGDPAPPIRLLPRELDPSRLPPPSAREGVPIGVEERGLDPVWVDFGGPDPHFLVFGDSQTGKSSLLRGLGRGLIAAHAPDELQLVVVDVRRSLLDLAHDEHVMAYAASPPAAQQAAERLRAIAGERMAPADASPLAAPTWHGPRYVVLFDDYDLVAGPDRRPARPAARRARGRRRRRPLGRAQPARRRQRPRRVRGRLRAPARARLARRPAQRRPGGGAAARRHQGTAAAARARAVRAPR